jgi:CDGSH-type Zn-finger protein
MKKEKKYYLKRVGNRKLSHLLVNVTDEKDVIKLCACGRTERSDFTCDSAHKKEIEINCSERCCRGD